MYSSVSILISKQYIIMYYVLFFTIDGFSKDDSKIVQLVKAFSTGLLSELPQSRVLLADHMFKTMSDKSRWSNN